MTSTSQSPLVASAVVGALIVAAVDRGAFACTTPACRASPSGSSQGAGPPSAGETDAIVQFRAAAREEQASAIVVAAR